MEITSELMNKIKKAQTPEELLQVAKENDANISLEDAKMIFSIIQNSKKKK